MKSSIGRALQVANGLHSSAGRALVAAASNSFTTAMHTAVAVAAVIAFVGALEVVLFLPGRAADEPAVATNVLDLALSD